MNEERVNNAILTLEVLIDECKEDGTYYTAQKEWEALAVFKQLQNNWNELKSRLQERIKFFEECDKELILSSYKKEIRTLNVVLDDMQELEQGKDENNE